MRKKDMTTIVFRNEDLLNKKLITSFLLTNDVNLVPTNNNYSEYEAVIKVRDLSLTRKNSKSPRSDNNGLLNQINEMYSMIEQENKKKKVNKKPNAQFYEQGRIDNIKTPELREEDSILDNERHPVNPQDILIKAIKIQSSPKRKSPSSKDRKSYSDDEHFSFVQSKREENPKFVNNSKIMSPKLSPKSPKSPKSPIRSPKIRQFSSGEENYYSSNNSQKKYSDPFSINPGFNKKRDDLDENSPAGKLRYYHSQESQAEKESRHSSRVKETDSNKNRSSDDPEFSEVRVGKNFVERKSSPLKESKLVSNQMNTDSNKRRNPSKPFTETAKSINSRQTESNRLSSNPNQSDKDQFMEQYYNDYVSPQENEEIDESEYASIDFRKQLDKLRAINEALQNKNQVKEPSDREYEPFSSSSYGPVETGGFNSKASTGTRKVPRGSYADDIASGNSPVIFKDISIVNIPALDSNQPYLEDRNVRKNFPSERKESNYDSKLRTLGRKLNVPEDELAAMDLILKKLFPNQDPLTVIKRLAATNPKEYLPLRIRDLPREENEAQFGSKGSYNADDSFLSRVHVKDSEYRSPGNRILESQKHESTSNYKSPRSQSPPDENIYKYYEMKSKMSKNQQEKFSPNHVVKRETSPYDNLFLIKANAGVKKTPMVSKSYLTKSPAKLRSNGNSVQTPKKSQQVNRSQTERSPSDNELDNDEGWINIKKLEKENRTAKQNISDLVFFGTKAVEARKKFIENEKNFKKKVDENKKDQRSQSPIFRAKTSPMKNTSEVLAYKNNLQKINRLNEKKDIARKYSDFSQKSIENAISYYDQQENELEKIASPIKQGRLEGMSSFDILRYHQLKLKKAQCLQVDYVRKVNRECHSYSRGGDEEFEE